MMRINRMIRFHGLAVLLASLVSVLAGPRAGLSQTFSNGDVFVAVGNASVQWRRGDGALVKTLVAPIVGNVEDDGMAFDSAGNLYVTMGFEGNAVAVFDNGGNFINTFGSGYDGHPESIVVDSSGNVYVGQPDGSHLILKFDLTGTPLQQFSVNTETRGSDWLDLASDLCTMFYTSEGKHVKKFDVCANQQLPDLNTTALPGTVAYAHRLLSNGDTLVADTEQIVRLDDTGAVVQTYTVPGNVFFFALNIDPDGKSFWSADRTTGNVFKFDIASGNILLQFNATSSLASNSVVGGITVKGEITASGTPRTGICATRNARFWFTHAYNLSDPTCATLQRALQANVGGISLGFLRLPAFFENGDGVKDVNDALQEALGFYWKSNGRTGESGGSQNQKLSGSTLCKQRKLLAVELIAATANVELLGTDPRDCTYSNGGTVTNFPANLLQQARTVLSGDDPTAIVSMRALLKTFNKGGLDNDFPPGVVECSPIPNKIPKSIARDPTRQDTCPGINDSCIAAEAVFFPTNATNPFANSVFSRSLNLNKFHDDFQPSSCSGGGRDAVWKVKPNLGASGRQFTVSTDHSNFDTMLSVWSGDCTSSNLTQVTCTNAFLGTRGERLSFTTDGSNTFFIVGEGAQGQYGKLKIRITSP